MLHRILVPLDGSELAAKALVQARRLLRGPETDVILVRVVETGGLDPVHSAAVTPRLRLEASDYLARLKNDLVRSGIKARPVVGEGLAWEQIVDVARREEATLIVMTSHGRTGLARWVLGSVAEKVIRSSRIPVLVLRSFETGATGLESAVPGVELAFHKLLVPVDGGDLSLAALDPAARVAHVFGASVVLVQVESRFDYPPGTFMSRLVDPPKVSPGLLPADPARRLDHAGEWLAARGLTVTTLRVGGDAASRIVDLPRELGADLIVMATHARAGLTRFILGSVAEKVLRHSELPLLIIPPPDPRA